MISVTSRVAVGLLWSRPAKDGKGAAILEDSNSVLELGDRRLSKVSRPDIICTYLPNHGPLSGARQHVARVTVTVSGCSRLR